MYLERAHPALLTTLEVLVSCKLIGPTEVGLTSIFFHLILLDLYVLYIQGVSKKRTLSRCVNFNPKNVTISSGIDKKITIFLTHWSENAHFR